MGRLSRALMVQQSRLPPTSPAPRRTTTRARRQNIAARLEGIAQPGAICLSEDAFRQVRARLDLAVSDIGEVQLKNITQPVRVYSLEVGVAAEAKTATPTKPAAPERSPAPAPPDQPSIAVLAFQNMSGDPEEEYLLTG